MTLTEQKKLAKHICRLLKVTEVTFPIGRTSKGNLGLTFNENHEYEIMLDSIPLSTKDTLKDENNIELKRMLEKYFFETSAGQIIYNQLSDSLATGTSSLPLEKPKNKGGRPKKVTHGNTSPEKTS